MARLPGSRGYPIKMTISEDVCDFCKIDVIKVLGEGMSCDVVLTQSVSSPGCLMALKLLTLNEDVALKRKLFNSEVRAMKVFNHKHLMKAMYAFETPNRLCIFMAYCPLGSLNKCLPGLDYAQIELFLVQLASAVKHMHDNRIAHTDIKMPNILLQTHDHVLLADFGICFEMPEGVEEVPALSVGGTRAYMPPEKANGGLNGTVYPFKMDMYSLGVVLKAMIRGHDPEFPNFIPERSSMADVPELLMFCLENLLKENPAGRFSSKQLMDTLMERTQWKTAARELEVKRNSEKKSNAELLAELFSADSQLPVAAPVSRSGSPSGRVTAPYALQLF